MILYHFSGNPIWCIVSYLIVSYHRRILSFYQIIIKWNGIKANLTASNDTCRWNACSLNFLPPNQFIMVVIFIIPNNHQTQWIVKSSNGLSFHKTNQKKHLPLTCFLWPNLATVHKATFLSWAVSWLNSSAVDHTWQLNISFSYYRLHLHQLRPLD